MTPQFLRWTFSVRPDRGRCKDCEKRSSSLNYRSHEGVWTHGKPNSFIWPARMPSSRCSWRWMPRSRHSSSRSLPWRKRFSLCTVEISQYSIVARHCDFPDRGQIEITEVCYVQWQVIMNLGSGASPREGKGGLHILQPASSHSVHV